jgi:hypothetical protein
MIPKPRITIVERVNGDRKKRIKKSKKVDIYDTVIKRRVNNTPVHTVSKNKRTSALNELKNLPDRKEIVDIRIANFNPKNPVEMKILNDLVRTFTKRPVMGGHITRKKHKHIRGSGFFSNAFNKIKNVASSVANRIKTTFTGRNTLQPIARRVMEQHGDERIVNVVLHREPIQSAINKIINVLSFGNQAYDTLFHLYMIVTTDKGTRIMIQKNAVIDITTSIKSPHANDETFNVVVDKNITLNELMEKTKNYMGGNFLRYSAQGANCQNFIDSILTANNINSSSAKHFVNQDAKKIFSRLPGGFSKFADAMTGIASKADVMLNGVGRRKIAHKRPAKKMNNQSK